MEQNSDHLSAILLANKQSGVSWTAGDTSISHLTKQEMEFRLGYVPGPDELSLQERQRISHQQREAARQGRPMGDVTFPVQWDWRNKEARDFISTAKNQGECGACVAFATAATIDAMMRINMNVATGDPSGGLMPELSEGQLFFCGNPGTCQTGWNFAGALDYAKQFGLVPDTIYGYTGPGCGISLVKNWQSLTTKISGWKSFDATEAMKAWISTRGPLMTSLAVVYEDFRFYKEGVYKWNGTSPKISPDGKDQGHAICIIGYDESREAWLFKNSWGTDWGMNGCGYIAYGECGIDAQMWGITGLSSIYPFFQIKGTPSVCVYSSQTHYFYRDADDNIRDVIWTGHNWAAIQVTGTGGQTDGPAAASDPASVSYSSAGFNQMHCFYCDSNGFIWDARWSGHEWAAFQVTGKNGLAGGGTPAASKLAVTIYGGQLHCCYRNQYGGVFDVVSGDRWVVNSVTEGPAIGNLDIFVHSGATFNQMHYCYRQQSNYIYDSIWTGSNWVKVQVTGPEGKAPGAPLANGDPSVVIYSGQTHYCYRDKNGGIWDVIQDGNNWNPVQVAGPGGETTGPAAAGDPDVIVWSGAGYNQTHYCYRDSNGAIWDVQWTGHAWIAVQVTRSGGKVPSAPAAAGDPTVFTYSGAAFNQMHYCYRDTAGYIQDAVWNGDKWGYQTL